MSIHDVGVVIMLVAAILLAVGEIQKVRAIRLLATPFLLAGCVSVVVGLATTGVPTG